jgi:hypothetical protein
VADPAVIAGAISGFRTEHSIPHAVSCRALRWVVERTFGWLMNHRRLARDYETHPHRSEAMIHIVMIDLMSRRLTRESTQNWRDT